MRGNGRFCTTYSVESGGDGVYRMTVQTRCNAGSAPLITTQKLLISQLSPAIESKSVFISERGLTSSQWTEYSEHTKRVQYSTVPTSTITAEAVMVDGFALSQKDTAGVITSFTRSYTVNGMVLTQTNGMSLTQSYEPQRDLLTGMAYHRGSTLVAQRTYTYDTLGRPLSRSTARNGQTVNDTFGYNTRSELTSIHTAK